MNKQDLLNKLFHWNAELTIVDGNGTAVTSVYQRIVGDFDLQNARKAALRYTSQLRAKLTNVDSDDYQIYVAPVTTLNRKEQEVLLLFDEMANLQHQAEKITRISEPKEPGSDAPTVEFEKYQELDDTYEERYLKLLKENTEKLFEERKIEITGFSDQEITDLIIRNRIDAFCESELKTRFFEQCVYLGTYEDKEFKHRLYKNFDDFLNIPEFLKQQLMRGYADLEMSAINLKESQKIQSLDQASDLQKNLDNH